MTNWVDTDTPITIPRYVDFDSINTPKTKDYDKKYFDSLICPHGTLHANRRRDHYSSGEKYCAHDEVFLKVGPTCIRCPKCSKLLRTSHAHD